MQFPDILSAISTAKNELITPLKYRETHEQISYIDKQIGEAYEEYQKRLRKNNALDFDDLLLKTVELFRNEPEVLLSFEETPGASRTLNEWIGKGHCVSVITGRPYRCHEVSRLWLDRHGLQNVRLYCLDKYGRENRVRNSDFNLRLEDFYRMKFDLAVEDSPVAFRFFDHLPELKVMVFDRPWNQTASLPGANYRRCGDWESIRAIVSGIA